MKLAVTHRKFAASAPWLKTLELATGAIVLTLAAVAVLLVALDVNPLSTFGFIVIGAVGSPYNLSETLVQATPLILAGLGVALSFTARLWNIGAEGQLYAGAIGAASVGLNVLGLPLPVVMPLALLAGVLAGAVWGLIPAVLKLRFQAQEVLVTIMLNYVAIIVSSMIISGPWAHGIVPRTRSIVQAAELPVVFPGTRFHIGVLIALACAVVVWGLMYRTVLGYRIRVVGLNVDAARLAGIRIGTVVIATFCISGGLAGLAGATLVLGIHHALVDGLSPGYGYTAIAVALLGGLQPLWSVMAAVLFAALYVGSQNMQIVAGLPVSLVLVIQSLLVLVLLATRVIHMRGSDAI
jgi:simple sugar transport system permease protein